jgi:hypothetical protein
MTPKSKIKKRATFLRLFWVETLNNYGLQLAGKYLASIPFVAPVLQVQIPEVVLYVISIVFPLSPAFVPVDLYVTVKTFVPSLDIVET